MVIARLTIHDFNRLSIVFKTTFVFRCSADDSVSATDVAEYLKEFSKGITSQITSEIREVTNAMNDSDYSIGGGCASSDYSSRRFSPPDIFDQSFTFPAKE